MKTAALFAFSTLAATTFAVPVVNGTVRFDPVIEDASITGVDDFGILAYALTLEHLEAAFYAEAVTKFSAADFPEPTLYGQILRLARDEQVHADALSHVLRQLGQAVPRPCKYSFPYNTGIEFLQLAAIIEGVGVSTYSGAAPSIRNPAILTMAASILPVEARHDAILRIATGVPPYASPFDVPLDFNQVYSLASQFIIPGSCPDSISLKLTAFPTLTVVRKDDESSATIEQGATITLKAGIDITAPTPSASTPNTRSLHGSKRHSLSHKHKRGVEKRNHGIYAAWLTAQGAIITTTELKDGTFVVQVPEDIAGQNYVILISSKDSVHDETTLAGPAIVEVKDFLSTDGGNKC